MVWVIVELSGNVHLLEDYPESCMAAQYTCLANEYGSLFSVAITDYNYGGTNFVLVPIVSGDNKSRAKVFPSTLPKAASC
jgi:expansin (peptidoglycan-binding protein)